MSRRLIVSAGIVVVMALALLLPGASAMAQGEGTVVADGFNGPQGVLVGPDGSVYVIDAGMGGDEEVEAVDPETGETVAAMMGDTAQIVQIAPDGAQTVLANMPSLIVGDESIGGARLALVDDVLYATNGAWQGDAMPEPLPETAVVLKVADGETSVAAKPWRIEKRMNPDDSIHESHPYGLAVGPDGKLYVADAGANTLLKIKPDTGIVEFVATFAPLPGVFPNPNLDGEMLTDAVPTGVVVNDDGTAYVSYLSGAPFVPGSSKVVLVQPNGGYSDYATGLTMLTDLREGPDGELYAVQFAVFTDQGPTPESGAIVRVVEGDGSQVVLDGLSFPTSVDFSEDGNAYVTINGVGAPGSGAVVMYEGLASGEGASSQEQQGVPAEESGADIEPSVKVSDQESDGSAVTVDAVASAQDGWIVIHASADGKPGTVLGQTAVPTGSSQDIVVEIDPPLEGEVPLWAMLHLDEGEVGTFEFPDGLDVPANVGDAIVMAPFMASVPAAEEEEVEVTAAAAEVEDVPSVTAADQEGDGMVVTVESVFADQDGWLVIHADANGKPGGVLGKTPVPSGMTENIIVVLDEALDGSSTVWAMLHVDEGQEGVYEFPDGPDVPATDGSAIVMAPFTVTAPMSEEAMAEESDAEDASAEETMAEESDAEDTSAEETMAEESDAEDASAEETMAEESDAEDTSAEETMAEESDAEDTSAEETMAEESDAEDASAEETMAEESDAGEDMADDVPAPETLPDTGGGATGTTAAVAIALFASALLAGGLGVAWRRQI